VSPLRRTQRRLRDWLSLGADTWRLVHDSVKAHPLRSLLAILGIVIGIVTVVLVASVLANVRNQVALLFRELGTENVFAYHRSGDPYAPPSEKEARRLPLEPAFAEVIAREAHHVRDVAVQLIVPPLVNGRALVARAGKAESDSVFVEGVSWPFFDVVNSEFAQGRPFTELEARAGARVVVLGANVAKALFGGRPAVGLTLTLGGESWTVVGVQPPRKGGFFGENRNDNVLFVPLRAAQRRYTEAKATVFYARAKPGERDLARVEVEAILRRLRRLLPDQPNDFELSTADQIIRSLDQVSAAIGLVTFALAAVSLLIGGIGIANVMVIAVTERTREIGIRRALGAPRRTVLRQFLLEAAFLSGVGGIAGVLAALGIGLLITLVAPGFSAMAPAWAIASGLGASVLTGLLAGYLPARRAAQLDPVEALRYE
jgi:putative ABC transport system permease protein